MGKTTKEATKTKIPRQKTASLLSQQTGKSSVKMGSTSKCHICEVPTNVFDKGMSCDACQKWECITCSQVPETVYDAMQGQDVTKLKFKCEDCTKKAPQDNAILDKLDQVIQFQAQQFSTLDTKVTNMESNMDIKFTNLEEVMEEKIDSKINEKMEQLFEEKVQNTMRKEIVNEVKEILKEQKDRERKECNVVFFNIAEPTATIQAELKTADMSFIVGICEEMGVGDITIQKMFRLGKKNEDSAKPRPIKVCLTTQQERKAVLTGARNLKDTKNEEYKKVGIAPDQTLAQREMRKATRKDTRNKVTPTGNDKDTDHQYSQPFQAGGSESE